MNVFMYSVEVTEHEFQIHDAKYNFIIVKKFKGFINSYGEWKTYILF